MLTGQAREVHSTTPASAAGAALTTVLARALGSGDAAGPGLLDAVAAPEVRASGRSPNQVAAHVRRALAAAVSGTMTVTAFDAVARRLVQYARRRYFAADRPAADALARDGGSPESA